MKKSLYFAFAAVNLATYADIEIIEEFNVNSDTEISVESGQVKRIEYLSGTASCTISKTGGGILELAIIGNTNASIFVKEGTLKSVPPAKLKLDGDRLFHADAADTDSLALSMENGTNFVMRIGNSDDLVPDMYAEKASSRPNPYLLDDALNGLPVFDFGSFKSPCRGESKSGQPWRAKAERLLGKGEVRFMPYLQGNAYDERPPWGAAAGVESKSGISVYHTPHETADSEQVGCRPCARHGYAAGCGFHHPRTGDGIA